MLDERQIRAVFLFEFKLGHKAAETTHNINNTFAQKLLTNVYCSSDSRSFAKEVRALKMRSFKPLHFSVTSRRKLTVTN